MKETDLLNTIKQSEDEAQGIIDNASLAMNKLLKDFEEEKESIINDFKEKIEKEIREKKLLLEKQFEESLKKIENEQKEIVKNLKNKSKMKVDSVVQGLVNKILELEYNGNRKN